MIRTAFALLVACACPWRPAAAETITVCAKGCDHTSINAAISAASAGDVVQLAEETYLEGEPVDPQGKSIVIRGALGPDGRPASVLSGANEHRVLVCASGESAGTRFESLVIRDGRRSSKSSPFGGGGAAVVESSPRFIGCVFVDNVTTNDSFLAGGGGGALVYDGSPRFDDCIFEGNRAPIGGGIRIIDSSVVIDGGRLVRNEASLDSGGGIDAYRSGVTLSGVLVEDNTATLKGGGMQAGSTNVAINFSAFRGNRAGSGGGVWLEDFGLQSVVSSTFSGNVATTNDGGGAYVQYRNPPEGALWTGCTFFGNDANGAGGAIAVNGVGTGGLGDPGWRCVVTDFIQNSAGTRGGAIEFSGNFINRRPRLSEADFSGNSAPDGASISLGSSFAELTGCDFDACCQVTPLTAFEDGGGNDLGWPCVNCIGDVTCDDRVSASDLGRLVSGWGTASPRYDLNEDGNVDAADLGLLIGAWGLCE